MRERIERALRAVPVRYAELRWEQIDRSAVDLHSRTLVRATTAVDEGGIVRVLAPGGGWGTATLSALDDLDRALAAALESARAVESEEILLHPIEPVVDERSSVLKEDFRRVSLLAKRQLLEGYEDLMLGHDRRIQDTRAGYRDSFRRIWYATSEGTWIRDERPLVDLYFEAIAVSGDDLQVASEGLGRALGFECARNQEELARSAARRAVAMLEARPVKGGIYTVITDPTLTGVFIHEAFGHLCEADHIAENPRLEELIRLGKRVGPDFLNVSDYAAPEAQGLMGNFHFDDEGVPGGRTELIREGVLVGRLHSRETAARLGGRPTGNARAQDFHHEPLVRMTKTVIERGETSVEKLFEGIALGLYARGSRGGMTELGRYSFGAEEAFLIRDGKLAERVRDVTLSGNIFDTLRNVSAVGDDFKLDSRGRCGKSGQTAPVSLGGPHVRIENVVVGGEFA